MGKKRKELSHEEIWDDSGLVESWNQSYEEYKRYHSIHARGENLKDLIAEAEAAEKQVPVEGSDTILQSGTAQSANVDDTALEDGELQDDAAPINSSIGQEATSEITPNSQLKAPQEIASSEAPELSGLFSNVAEGSTQDQGLKNLMMSWYWAGYYTGFYEGQRASGVQAPSNSHNGSAS
ncbi:MAG: hypothetical protein MMC23_005370 [Stictis urceolatum]|nr:hypothetical protein [Stictis urceolata]